MNKAQSSILYKMVSVLFRFLISHEIFGLSCHNQLVKILKSFNIDLPPPPQDEVQLAQIVVMMAVAFRRLEMPQNLTGLYVWCKEKAGKRFPWLR